MIEVNWKQDYCKDFSCFKCQQAKLHLAGVNRQGKQRFRCPKCKFKVQSAINLNRRSQFLESRLIDGQIDWGKDYKGEFACPKCQSLGMIVRGIDKHNKKRIFNCNQCNHTCINSNAVNIKILKDPINPGLIWFKNYRIPEFICPKCQTKNIYIKCIDQHNKKIFCCKQCGKFQYDYVDCQNKQVLSRLKKEIPLVTPFDFDNDLWDLRAINSNFNSRERSFSVNFSNIHPQWFKRTVKKYVQHKCKINSALSSTKSYVSDLRNFANYLNRAKVNNFGEINRHLLLDYFSQEKKITEHRLVTLRNFFITGAVKGWFNIDQDIIRNEDYPQRQRGNPEPLSDTVREQIEQNLHKLPDSIARMWIICFFAAMRPGELAMLKQDCLVQEGQHWKLVWQRQKSKDYHQVPISRTIAKVVQEQLSYIQDLYNQDWNYLFCHYHGLSKISLSKIELEPVKKVFPSKGDNPLVVGVRTLIKDLDIRDENGQPAKFKTKLLRTTRLTQLFEQGHDLAVVSAWAGHKHFATTSTYYTKVSCDLIEQEAGHIQKALVNSDGHRVPYESFPKSFWEKPQAHKLELSGTHINTPIYGYCGLDLDQDCHKFRACYTCGNFVATPEKLPQYIKTRDELRGKQSKALASGQDVLVEQFGTQADQLDKIIASLQEAA